MSRQPPPVDLSAEGDYIKEMKMTPASTVEDAVPLEKPKNPPRKRAKALASEAIEFSVSECSLGWVLAATTTHGICAIEFGDSAEVLADALTARFPEAGIKRGGAGFENVMAEVAAFVENPSAAFGLPLDIRGTVLQRTVWQVLRAIPPGTTMTYSEVAAAAGCPGAVRAVASACASNRIAIAIPCHRVVRTGGALSGYRWGVERKAKLLRREGAL
jgi:AraC family transcriptional regulator, regulatory protein of adaptative response / methylated-DNA-[protein]-cysteine methyltransferase